MNNISWLVAFFLATLAACGGRSGAEMDPVCGNAVIEEPEACDDGNVVAGDGCSELCALEVCGNGVVDMGELCDDANSLAGDGCSADCLSDESCGNGIVDLPVGEACDDGNTTSGDGCQANCALPTCGDAPALCGSSQQPPPPASSPPRPSAQD